MRTGLPNQALVDDRSEPGAVRAAQPDDPLRPRYHFTAPHNWLNDPNGLIQWRGRYHLFYQHNPNSPLWGTIHWGHAVSHDLVHWTDLPLALAPTPGAADAAGVFSGCAVDDHGTPAIIYTGVHGPRQSVCLATGDDELLRWHKAPDNPVISGPPPGLDILRDAGDGAIHFRDPSVWREGDAWSMIVGTGITGVGGAILLYRSPDLRRWEYVHPLLTGDRNRRDPVWTGSMWECPQLFPLGDRHVLLFSVWHEHRTYYAVYFTGSLVNGRFRPERGGVIDPGSFYAPQTFRDDQGRRIMIGWLREQRDQAAMAASAWNGAMSIPWLLHLAGDGRLCYTPAPELALLRGTRRRFEGLSIGPDEARPLPDVAGDCLELDATIRLGAATAVGLLLRQAPDKVEGTRVVYEPGTGTLRVDRRCASLAERSDCTRHEASLTLSADEPLRLRVFLDRSVLELVANERVLLSARIYPSRADSLGVGLFAAGGPATFERLDVWPMRSIWSQTQ